MTTAANPQIVPRPPAALPALRAADKGVADALEAVLSDNTQRVYAAQWKLFDEWCDDVGLRSLPAEPLTVARYLAARAGADASIATLRLASSAIAKAHEWAGHESPCRDSGPHRGRRTVWGGRPRVRAVLYMGILVATRCNPVIQPVYQRLLAAGKPKKLALTACMRKLLTILNIMVRNGQHWSPTIGTP